MRRAKGLHMNVLKRCHSFTGNCTVELYVKSLGISATKSNAQPHRQKLVLLCSIGLKDPLMLRKEEQREESTIEGREDACTGNGKLQYCSKVHIHSIHPSVTVRIALSLQCMHSNIITHRQVGAGHPTCLFHPLPHMVMSNPSNLQPTAILSSHRAALPPTQLHTGKNPAPCLPIPTYCT